MVDRRPLLGERIMWLGAQIVEERGFPKVWFIFGVCCNRPVDLSDGGSRRRRLVSSGECEEAAKRTRGGGSSHNMTTSVKIRPSMRRQYDSMAYHAG